MQVYDSIKVKSALEGYAKRADELELDQRLELVLDTCYKKGVRKVVLGMPGALTGHPLQGVALQLREMLWRYAYLFEEVILVAPPGEARVVSEIIFPSQDVKKQQQIGGMKKGHSAPEDDVHGEQTAAKAKGFLLAGASQALILRMADIEERAAPHIQAALEERKQMLRDGSDAAGSRGRRKGVFMSQRDALVFKDFVVAESLPPKRTDALALGLLAQGLGEELGTGHPAHPSRSTRHEEGHATHWLARDGRSP